MPVPIRLETSDGKLVSDEECILPFNQNPDIVIWGERIFRLVEDKELPVYREGFSYYITGLEKKMKRPQEAADHGATLTDPKKE